MFVPALWRVALDLDLAIFPRPYAECPMSPSFWNVGYDKSRHNTPRREPRPFALSKELKVPSRPRLAHSNHTPCTNHECYPDRTLNEVKGKWNRSCPFFRYLPGVTPNRPLSDRKAGILSPRRECMIKPEWWCEVVDLAGNSSVHVYPGGCYWAFYERRWDSEVSFSSDRWGRVCCFVCKRDR